MFIDRSKLRVAFARNPLIKRHFMATTTEEFVPAKTAAAILDISPVTLRRWRREQLHTNFLQYVKRFDGRYYYQKDGVQALKAAAFN